MQYLELNSTDLSWRYCLLESAVPSVDPIFKIMKAQPNGERRMKTALEFGEALMYFLGKRNDRTMIEYNKFQETLNKFSV